VHVGCRIPIWDADRRHEEEKRGRGEKKECHGSSEYVFLASRKKRRYVSHIQHGISGERSNKKERKGEG